MKKKRISIKLKYEQEACSYFNLQNNYFIHARSHDPKRIILLSKLGINAIEAYSNFLKIRSSLQARLMDIYLYLEENKQLYKFSIFLYRKRIIKNKNSFISSSKYTIFQIDIPFRTFKTLQKYNNIEDEFILFCT